MYGGFALSLHPLLSTTTEYTKSLRAAQNPVSKLTESVVAQSYTNKLTQDAKQISYCMSTLNDKKVSEYCIKRFHWTKEDIT